MSDLIDKFLQRFCPQVATESVPAPADEVAIDLLARLAEFAVNLPDDVLKIRVKPPCVPCAKKMQQEAERRAREVRNYG